jgi:hypothetical protein
MARLQAEEAYQACLTHQDKHGAAHLALARLALANGQVRRVECLAQCDHRQLQHVDAWFVMDT